MSQAVVVEGITEIQYSINLIARRILVISDVQCIYSVTACCNRVVDLKKMMDDVDVSTFAPMTTGAFSQNVGKLFSELKLVTDNLLSNDVDV